MHAPRRPGGFTLVEMLVAVTVLAILGVMSWRGLGHLIDQRARVGADVTDLENVVRSLAQLERDVLQRITDAQHEGRIGVASGLPLAITLSMDPANMPRIAVLRTRTDRYGAQRVVWFVEKQSLVRESAALGTSAVPERSVLLERTEKIGARVLLRSGWTDAKRYLDAGLGVGPASALEVSISRVGGERFVKVVPL